MTDRKRGVLHARVVNTLAPPPDAVVPRCAVFGTCGGCSLQQLDLETQRVHKHAAALREIGDGLGEGVCIHPVRGTEQAYGYRNKLELLSSAPSAAIRCAWVMELVPDVSWRYEADRWFVGAGLSGVPFRF